MKKGTVRTIPIIFLLNIATCGWYYIYWVYQTSSEIKSFTEREDLNPALELILGIVTCGLYFKYWYYKYGKIVYKEMPLKVGMNNTDDKTMALVFIDIIVALVYIFRMFLNFFLIILSYAEEANGSSVLTQFIGSAPFGFIYIVNISSLIMQDKLNNIWNKVQ